MQGFVAVTKDEFFATVGQMNVHPRTDVSTLRERHIRSDWETPDRVRHGVSFGAGPAAKYFVRVAKATT